MSEPITIFASNEQKIKACNTSISLTVEDEYGAQNVLELRTGASFEFVCRFHNYYGKVQGMAEATRDFETDKILIELENGELTSVAVQNIIEIIHYPEE